MFTVTVTPGTNWAIGDFLTEAKLNLTANPTIAVSGTFADLTDYSAVSATTKTFTVQDQANDILRVAGGHDASLGQRVKVSSSTTLPAGLSASPEYFLRPDTTNPSTDFTLHYSLAGAQNNTGRVDIQSAGSGTHTLTYFTYATGKPLIRDTGGNTWEVGIVSPENLPEMVGATGSAPGTRGAVPQPGPGDRNNFLRGDGTWADPTAGTSIATNLFLYYATR
jgi:hypothetical protein